jgi:short chain dehydrogenase
MASNTRPLAIVTGASSGIGYELAKCCVDYGFDVLIAADEPAITEAAQDFRTLGAVVETVEADLATLDGGSCTRPLRIIPLVPKPGKMPSSHNDLRGHCHGVTPFLLPTRSVGHHMALHHVVSQLAQAKRDPDNRASHAHQAQAFPRVQSVHGPDAQASLRVV